MNERWRAAVDPMSWAALITWVAIGLSLRFATPANALLVWSLLVAFLLAFVVLRVTDPHRTRLCTTLLLLEGLLALALIWLYPRPGTAQILLVIWAAQLAMIWPLRTALLAVLVADVAYYLIVRESGHGAPLLVVVVNAGFQLFACLCAHYARSAEQARDQLLLVNADLLATRALLADSARDSERLRVARELHDVAGHKLTALTLNLRALAQEPVFAQRHEVALAQQLSSELLGDIRGVVHALRRERGLDLATALRALAAPMPKPALQLQMTADVRIDDPALAETILRIVQEALTNAARHAGASTLRVSLAREADALRLTIDDDGRVRGAWQPGNGLTGMRERIEACGGAVDFALAPAGSLRIDARLPVPTA